MIILIALITFFSLTYLFINTKSSGRLPKLKDQSGKDIKDSISEKVMLTVGGTKQGLFLLGEKANNPVLLFLHGGPGTPELPLLFSNDGTSRLEEEFIVCYWDQRGAGMSFEGVDPNTMNLDQLISDTLEVTYYLQERFQQNKIYLMGHSWGTLLGVKTIQQAPENYLAYIGMGQMTNQGESEKLAYEYLFNHAKKTNDQKAMRSLLKYDVTNPDFPSKKYMMTIRSSLLDKYGVGTTHEKFSITNFLKYLLFFTGYTLKEKIAFFRGQQFSIKELLHYTEKADLFNSAITFELPIYITQGTYDYQVSYKLAKKYYNQLEAPKKQFFSFENSAHSPIYEEKKKYLEVMKLIKRETMN